ncbi:MAG: class I SAM-dependent DNA methyltransferase, partial [Desulfobacterales bacterium]|nr:class I SAM-dependent DNA methyltransferase [Desulfobacterales bacterium]
MPIDLTGISNENEFYTHHYLTAILEGDLKELFSTWTAREKEEGIKPPHAGLRSISGEFFKIRERRLKAGEASRKLELQRSFLYRFFDLLGYQCRPELKTLDDGSRVPVICEITKKSGAPELWVLDAPGGGKDDASPLERTFHPAWFEPFHHQEDVDPPPEEFFNTAIEEIISGRIFAMEEAPRWIILASLTRTLLLDRFKWNEKRLLRFDLGEIFSRGEPSTLKAVSALLSRDSICPPDGLCLLDALDENSHKNAFAVSEDLKYALRQSMEILGNEAIRHFRDVSREKLYQREGMARQLTTECLRYMYRLLFLFYIEARPELGYAPMKSDAYRMGCSLESLRDLELVKLTTEESQNGFYIHHSIQTLFRLIYDGFDPKKLHLDFGDKKLRHLFVITQLQSHLFDPARTRLLNKVMFRNSALQQVIRLMSLTRPAKGKKRRRGRISYAQLGINQLGAVYEALLSYNGFFAQTDLYEVKKARDKYNEL